MSVVGSHDDALLSFLLNFQEGFHHFIHRHVALEVVCFVEVAFCISLSAAKMYEIDAVPETAHHGRQVVFCAYAERACAETKPICRTRNSIDECLEVFCSAENSGQTKYRHGGIVWMNDEFHPGFFSNGAYFFEEIDEVCTQLFRCDVFVSVEFLLELFKRKTFFGARQACNHIACDELLFRFIHLLVTGFCLVLLIVCVLFFCSWTAQDEEVEGYEGCFFEAKSTAAVGHFVCQIGASPVENRHEVIGYDINATFSEVDEALLVIVDILLEVARLCFDMFVDRYAFYGCPTQASVFNNLLALEDFLFCPNHAIGDVV